MTKQAQGEQTSDPLQIFVCWSGENNRDAAESVKEFLEKVFDPAVRVTYSEDIPVGDMWLPRLLRILQQCDIGFLCINSRNANSPWLHFEAGAIASALGEKQVIPLYFDIDPNQLNDPFRAFHGMKVGSVDGNSAIKKLIVQINERLPKQRQHTENVLMKKVDDMWNGVVEAHEKALQTAKDTNEDAPALAPEPDVPDKLDDLRNYMNTIEKIGWENSQNLASVANELQSLSERLDRLLAYDPGVNGTLVAPNKLQQMTKEKAADLAAYLISSDLTKTRMLLLDELQNISAATTLKDTDSIIEHLLNWVDIHWSPNSKTEVQTYLRDYLNDAECILELRTALAKQLMR